MINIWTLKKDDGLRQALLLLQHELGEHAFMIDLSTATDAKAIYLRAPWDAHFRAYLFTLGQTQNRCGLHLEFPTIENEPEQFYAFENLTIESVIEKLIIHFDIVKKPTN